MTTAYFTYTDDDLLQLKNKDSKLANVIDKIGKISRPLDTDLFSAVIHHIVGQQISNKALSTIWQKLTTLVVPMNAETILSIAPKRIQQCGISFKKVFYITDFSKKVVNNTFDCKKIETLDDASAIEALTSLSGIGTWTAEMILLFCFGRMNILSYKDLAIQKGLRMVYHHRKITPALFEKYRRRYSPFGSIASLYLWAVANGAIENMKDFAPRKTKVKKTTKK